jgi:hypothetical protein
MTSKEKAAELIVKYQQNIKSLQYDKAKQCALLAVEQLIEHSYQVMKTFWQEVKTEIEKL